jgi:hypothetical protein
MLVPDRGDPTIKIGLFTSSRVSVIELAGQHKYDQSSARFVSLALTGFILHEPSSLSGAVRAVSKSKFLTLLQRTLKVIAQLPCLFDNRRVGHRNI